MSQPRAFDPGVSATRPSRRAREKRKGRGPLALALAVALASGAVAQGVVPGGQAPVEALAIRLINGARARGQFCPGGGGGVSLPPLAFEPALRALAYSHAYDMGSRGYLSHFEPGGGSPRARVQRAGYRPSRMSEIIYKHSSIGGRAESAVNWWLHSPVHCRAIMNPNYTVIGVGYSSVGKSWSALLASSIR